MVVKTVSNKSESAEKSTLAEESVRSLSFLQELIKATKRLRLKAMKRSFLKKSNLMIIWYNNVNKIRLVSLKPEK